MMRQRLAYAGFSAAAAVLGFLVSAAAAPVMMLTLAAVVLLPRRRDGRLVPDGRALTVPLSLSHAVMVAALLGFSVSQARLMLGRDGFLSAFEQALGVFFIVLAVAVAVMAGAMVVRPPGLRLTPDGVQALSYRSKVLRWDELPGPVMVTGRWRAVQTVLLTPRRAIAAVMLAMDAVRFAAVAEYYRTHPEHRAAIGTAEEYARLEGLLDAGYSRQHDDLAR